MPIASEILHIAFVTFTQRLPVVADQIWLCSDVNRPTQLGGSLGIESPRSEPNSPPSDLLYCFSSVLWLFPILIRELDEVDEVVQVESDSESPGIDKVGIT